MKVYEVSTESAHVSYQISSEEWKGKWTRGVAVSDSLPNSMLVIFPGKPYVYQYPCHEATQEVKKYRIHGHNVDPYCVVANANTCVIGLDEKTTIIVCRLPNFDHQSHVQITFIPYDLSISTDYLLVMGNEEIVLKSLDDVSGELTRIESPGGWLFVSVAFRFDAREIFAACYKQGGKGCVYKFLYNGKSWAGRKRSAPKYVISDQVLNDIGLVWHRCLTVTTDGLLVACEWNPDKVKIYNLE